jgi:hypothetical protein
MTQEELKSIILNNVNMDANGKAEIERFFSECEGITAENCREKLWRWRMLEPVGTIFYSSTEAAIRDLKDPMIKKGLTAIQRGDYVVYENTHRLRTYVVENEDTKYLGLITESKEEILPCIFDSVNVSLDWFLDLVFKGQKFEGGLRFNRDLPQYKKYGFWYGNEGGYYIDAIGVKEGSPRWRCLQQLIDLLNENHRCVDNQDN